MSFGIDVGTRRLGKVSPVVIRWFWKEVGKVYNFMKILVKSGLAKGIMN